GRLSPSLAARWAETLFFRPSRAEARPQEEEFLAEGERFSFSTSRGTLAAWAWGSGPAVLLVHGWSSRTARFRVIAPALVNSGFRVVGYDHPAHGASPGKRTSLLEVSETLLEVTQQTGPLHAAVGHSLGGAAIAVALSRGLSLERAVLIAPFSASPDFVARFAEMVNLPAAARDRMIQNIESRFQMRFQDLYIPSLVSKLTVPALIIHDREDLDIPFSEGEAIAKAWPGAEMVEAEGVGHHGIMRDEEVAARVARFLGK
ncbi:MAG TPA: alpha/beta hydrolase, partial [Gemmatimonadales bacterium]|nr:alpha/beta hydrolase [Gemmatimonadales bacterium]